MPTTLLTENQLDELQAIGQVSLDELNQLLQNMPSESEVEALYDELEKRGIVITSSPKSTLAPKSPKRHATEGDLDDVLESLADLESLMQRWDAVAETESENLDDPGDASAELESGLDQLMNRVGKMPLLDKAQEQELLWRVREGTEEESQAARRELMEVNQRLVLSIARNYVGKTNLSLQDLLQEGTLGLAKAIDLFGQREGRLSSYATWWIRRSIRKALENSARSMRLPGEFYATIRQLQALQAELAQKLGHNPTLTELAEAADLPLSKVEEALRAGHSPLSLEQPIGEENELGESLRSDTFDGEISLSRSELREELELALATLSENERMVVEKRYGIGDYEDNGATPAEEVARELNFTLDKVRRLEVQALRKLRRRSKNAAFGDLLY